jgi:DNA processing protein
LSVAHRLAGDLAVGGVCVVSGMARGCDAAAHDGALEGGGATIAVLGSGADVCYPAGSRTLYAEIAAKGAIVSAHPPGYVPHKHDFVYRNDIMVAMSVAVVVVQGDKHSAAVETGERAAGRGTGNVFAVPGSIEWPQSEGVHGLLKSGANVCTLASDIADVLEGAICWNPPEVAPVPAHLPDAQQRILKVLSRGAAGREQIITESGLAAAEASMSITRLELQGYVVEEGFLLRRTR